MLIVAGASAQLAPGPGQRCGVDVAFEPLGVREAFTQREFVYHAIVLVSSATGRAWIAAYEGNPTGHGPVNWGRLVARQRDLSGEPLKRGTLVKVGAPVGLQTCTWLTDRMRQLMANLNSSRVRYAPTPATSGPKFDGANSNSFTYWAVSRLNVVPPPAPPGTYGYYANLVD
jgi:hypothetical protein